MSRPSFIHLHNHTDYSLLDSAIRIDSLIAKAVEYNMPAVAITDSNNICGAVQFYLKCREAGIKPIIGAEIRVSSVLPFKDKGDKHAYKLVLLCMNLAGYRNLCRIVSAACSKGFQETSPVSPAMLAAHSEGLICLSGGKESELASLCRLHEDYVWDVVCWYNQHFSGRYYIELSPDGNQDWGTLSAIASKLDIPLVAAADCRCLALEDARLLEVLHCIRAGATLEESDKTGAMIPCFHSPDSMWDMFGYFPEALANTLEIAARCNLELPLDEWHVPRHEAMDSASADEALQEMAHEGLKNRIVIIRELNPALSSQHEAGYQERLRYELECINAMKCSDYFLVVADYVNWAKDNGIPVGPGRGAVCGSLVAYALGITCIDPIQQNLVFERFLDPEQAVFPDIDLDFCMERRDEVIGYLVNRYGREKVCRVAGFGTFHGRSTIRNVVKIMGISKSLRNKIIRLLPESNLMLKLDELGAHEPAVAELLEISSRLEGIVSFMSVHPCGFVIAPTDIQEFMPVEGLQSAELPVSQFTFRDVERIGMVKFDLLGLEGLNLNSPLRQADQA